MGFKTNNPGCACCDPADDDCCNGTIPSEIGISVTSIADDNVGPGCAGFGITCDDAVFTPALPRVPESCSWGANFFAYNLCYAQFGCGLVDFWHWSVEILKRGNDWVMQARLSMNGRNQNLEDVVWENNYGTTQPTCAAIQATTLTLISTGPNICCDFSGTSVSTT